MKGVFVWQDDDNEILNQFTLKSLYTNIVKTSEIFLLLVSFLTL